MKMLLCLALLTNSCAYTETRVYICDSKGSARYHYKENCRGLNACKHAVIGVTIEEAKKRGKTLCKWED